MTTKNQTTGLRMFVSVLVAACACVVLQGCGGNGGGARDASPPLERRGS